MFRKLLTTTAFVAFAATGAIAQDKAVTLNEEAFWASVEKDHWLATDLIGLSVESRTGEGAETIGEIDNLIVGSDGQVDAAIIGVGGFLGIGEKDIAVEWNQLEVTPDEDGDVVLVLNASRESLENAPEFTHELADETASAAVGADSSEKMKTAESEDKMAEAKTEVVASADADKSAEPVKRMEREAVYADKARDTLKVMEIGDIRAERLIGMRVYTHDNEDVGEVGDLIIKDGGEIDAVIVDFGGFLGIGEKEVAVGFEDIEFRTDGGDTIYVYTRLSEEQVEHAPEYDKASYEERREEMRVVGGES